MLHELLLSLSGHPSPLLRADGHLDESIGALISPSERALLRKLASLGTLHNEVRSRAATVNNSPTSVICKAIAAAISDIHLARYQDKIIEVERSILKSDSKYVAAYNAVPLSTIVIEFDGWTQILEWLKELLDFMQSRDTSADRISPARSGAQVLNHLRASLRTGYPDLESTCRSLVEIGEAAWLRQLSSWLLYGKLPTFGSEDFLVKAPQDAGASDDFGVDHALAPGFVTKATCDSILFVGKSIAQLNSHRFDPPSSSQATARPDLRPFFGEGISELSSLKSPISVTACTQAVNRVRSSLARHALSKLLPTVSVLQTLQVVHDFLLLQRGEFALALITSTDQHLASRSIGSKGGRQDAQGFSGAFVKEAELSAILNKAWASLIALRGLDDDLNGDAEDETFDIARDTITLDISRSKAKVNEDVVPTLSENLFQDLLVGTPTTLSMAIAPPLNLFLSPQQIHTYSHANALLLGVRRAHLRLTGLWKLSALRKTHPGPIRPVNSATQPKLTADRERAGARNASMRSTWAAAGAASLFLVELSEYFQGEVIASSWSAFSEWIKAPANVLGADDSSARDPETLAIAHQRYLSAIIKGLLLHDQLFTRELRQLLGRVDHLVGLVHRFEVVVKTLMAGESAETSGPDHLQREEQTLAEGLRNARRTLEQALSKVVQRLKDVELEQLEDSVDIVGLETATHYTSISDNHATFFPWHGTGISSLTMKLEFARTTDGRVAGPG